MNRTQRKETSRVFLEEGFEATLENFSGYGEAYAEGRGIFTWRGKDTSTLTEAISGGKLLLFRGPFFEADANEAITVEIRVRSIGYIEQPVGLDDGYGSRVDVNFTFDSICLTAGLSI